jgi:hypothetical protein
MAAVTMVKGDHTFLARWVDYYGSLLGRENLFVLRHGHDPEIDRIAAGANILHQPDTGDATDLETRRWATLSHFTSGLTLYYNWVLCTEIDAIVAPDPATGLALPDYLDRLFASGRAPQVVAPLGIELLAGSEPLSTDPARPVLSEGRSFRLSGPYTKPCITRRRISFAPGGRGSSVREVHLDPNLFLFHLPRTGENDSEAPGIPVADATAFSDFAAALANGQAQYPGGHWVLPDLRGGGPFRLPDRFSRLF